MTSVPVRLGSDHDTEGKLLANYANADHTEISQFVGTAENLDATINASEWSLRGSQDEKTQLQDATFFSNCTMGSRIGHKLSFNENFSELLEENICPDESGKDVIHDEAKLLVCLIV